MINQNDLIETVSSELTELICDLVVSYDDIEDQSDAVLLILSMMLHFTLKGFMNTKFPHLGLAQLKERMHELVSDTLNFIKENDHE